jgi:hypothetical protein
VRRFVVAVGCFLAVLVVLDRAASWTMHAVEARYYAGGNDFERQLAAYLEGRPFDTLVLGTSRTEEAILPVLLEAEARPRVLRVFKEAAQGKGPRYQLQFYRIFKKHAGRPRLVICGVDYFVYSIQSDRRWLSRFGQGESWQPPPPRPGPLRLLQRKHQHDVFFNDLIGDLNDRAGRRVVPASDIFEQSRRHMGVPADPDYLLTKQPPSYSPRRMPRPPGVEGEDLERLLAEMHADGVPVVLVSLPDYVGTYRTNVDLPFFHAHLLELARRHPNVTVQIYDDPDRFDLRDPSLFRDGGWGRTNSHLSAWGAAELTRRLAGDLAHLSGASPRRVSGRPAS